MLPALLKVSVPAVTSIVPALFAAVAPPGSTNIPLTVGAITLGITAIAAAAAWSARETFRVHMAELGHRDAVPATKEEYERLRAQVLGQTVLAR